MDWFLWLCARAFFLGVTEHHIARCITSWSLPCGMQGLKKRDERRGLCRTQVLPVRRHVAASLDHLADELVLREPHGDAIQRRASLPAQLPEGMAVAALLDLQYDAASPLTYPFTPPKYSRHRLPP